jgi:hypothetical protein
MEPIDPAPTGDGPQDCPDCPATRPRKGTNSIGAKQPEETAPTKPPQSSKTLSARDEWRLHD